MLCKTVAVLLSALSWQTTTLHHETKLVHESHNARCQPGWCWACPLPYRCVCIPCNGVVNRAQCPAGECWWCAPNGHCICVRCERG